MIERWIPVHLYSLIPASPSSDHDPWSCANEPYRQACREELYEVSDRGRVRVKATGRILKPINRLGRKVVRLTQLPPAERRDPLEVERRSSPREVSVARLVLGSWRSWPATAVTVASVVAHHVDGDRQNCELRNLVWLTRSESQRLHMSRR
jgi:hypothetical protein